MDVADDITANSFIELLYQTLTHHAQVLPEGWIEHFHKQRLVFNELLARVACHHSTCYCVPSC